MQYILTEQEYNDLKQFEQKYKELQNDLNRAKEEAYNLGYKNGLVQLPLDSLIQSPCSVIYFYTHCFFEFDFFSLSLLLIPYISNTMQY